MKKKYYILIAVAALLMGCSATYTIPIDDVYYWPYQPAQTVETTESVPIEQTAKPTQENRDIEFINVQDTMVTIRVKK